MKTIGRMLIITAVFSVVAGLIVTIVNVSGMNAHAIDDTAQFRPQSFGNGGELRPPNFGNRPPERGERDGGGGASRLVLGMIQNVVVIGFLVTVIVRSVAKKKKRANAVATSNNK